MHDSDALAHQKRRRGKRVAIIVAVVAAVIVVLVGLLALAAFDGLNKGRAVVGHIETAQNAVVARDFEAGVEAIELATEEMEVLESRVRAFQFLSFLPYVGDQLDSLLILIEDGGESLQVIGSILQIGVDIEKDLQKLGVIEGLSSLEKYADMSPEAKRELVFALNRAVPDLEEAQARIRVQRAELEDMDQDKLFVGLKIARRELLSQIRVLDDSLHIITPVLSVLPEVGGFERPQQYLMFLQNTGELRPTGGFWGTYGVVTIKDGDIESIVTDDIYAVDFPSEGHVDAVAPAPIRRYLGLDTWYLRDANWSPDVPTSVRRALEFYKNETTLPDPQHVTAPRVDFDGAILVTPEVGVRLLEIFGDVTVNDVHFTPENFFDVLEYEVEQAFVEKGFDTLDRKDIIGDLIDVLFARMQEADTDTLGELVSGTLDLLDNNDIMAYGVNEDVQRIFEREGWAGDLHISAAHDHLMIVDANLAALKTDAMIDRAYTYSITKDLDGDLIATAQINYDHLGGFDYRTTRYRTYTRVYVPLGSEIMQVEGSLADDRTKNPNGEVGTVDVSEEFGATVFGTFTSVEPGANGELKFTYKLPDRIREMVDAGSYVLDVQRQPGVSDAALNLHLDFDEQIVAAEPPEVSEFWFNDSYTYTSQAQPLQTFRMEIED